MPFGFLLGEDGGLVPEPRQQEAIRHARSLRARGASLRAIAADLRERGHSVSHVSVSNMLRRAGDAA